MRPEATSNQHSAVKTCFIAIRSRAVQRQFPAPTPTSPRPICVQQERSKTPMVPILPDRDLSIPRQEACPWSQAEPAQSSCCTCTDHQQAVACLPLPLPWYVDPGQLLTSEWPRPSTLAFKRLCYASVTISTARKTHIRLLNHAMRCNAAESDFTRVLIVDSKGRRAYVFLPSCSPI